MIQVQLGLKQGVLHKCSVSGHAGFAKRGKDIVCAAVTVLFRTTIESLTKSGLFNIQTESFGRGSLSFCVQTKDASIEALTILKYTAEFLQIGLKRLCMEYPKCVSLDILAEA